MQADDIDVAIGGRAWCGMLGGNQCVFQGAAAGPAKFVVSIILVLLLCRLSRLRVSVPVVFSYLASGF